MQSAKRVDEGPNVRIIDNFGKKMLALKETYEAY